MSGSPYSLKHGVDVQARLADFAKITQKCNTIVPPINWELAEPLRRDREGKQFMEDYKKEAKDHCYGAWLGPKPKKNRATPGVDLLPAQPKMMAKPPVPPPEPLV